MAVDTHSHPLAVARDEPQLCELAITKSQTINDPISNTSQFHHPPQFNSCADQKPPKNIENAKIKGGAHAEWGNLRNPEETANVSEAASNVGCITNMVLDKGMRVEAAAVEGNASAGARLRPLRTRAVVERTHQALEVGFVRAHNLCKPTELLFSTRTARPSITKPDCSI